MLAQVAAERRSLKTEAKRIERERMTASHEVSRLVDAVSRAAGAAEDALMVKLAEVQGRVTAVERRRRELADREAALADQVIYA